MNQSRRKGDKRESKETACYFFLPSELHKSATTTIQLLYCSHILRDHALAIMQLPIFSPVCILVVNFIIKLPHKQLSLEHLSCKWYFEGQNKIQVKIVST